MNIDYTIKGGDKTIAIVSSVPEGEPITIWAATSGSTGQTMIAEIVNGMVIWQFKAPLAPFEGKVE